MNDKEASIKFTTSLPVPVLLELDRAAKEMRRKKNEIVVEALTVWFKEYNQMRLYESYNKNL